jgi:Mrp family chromosome partitioning ATPase
MMAMGRAKGLGRAPVSLSALPFEEKRSPFAALTRFRPASRSAAPTTPTKVAPGPRTLASAPAAAQALGQAQAVKSKPILAPALSANELEASMAQLWDALGPVPTEKGRVLQFVAAASGEGASTMAREFALYAAKKAKRPVWLVDLDLYGAAQHKAVTAEAARFGPLGRPSQASPDGSTFVAVEPVARTADGAPYPDARYVAAYAALRGRLWITRFRKEAMRPGQSVRLSGSPRYWQALAAHAEYVIIDTPAADRSSAAVTLADQVDATVMVVAAEGADGRGPAALKAAIQERGGQIAGPGVQPFAPAAAALPREAAVVTAAEWGRVQTRPPPKPQPPHARAAWSPGRSTASPPFCSSCSPRLCWVPSSIRPRIPTRAAGCAACGCRSMA